MSEQQSAEATATEATTESTEKQETGSEEQQPKPTETVDFWKQKAREQEKRAKDNADAAKRLGEIEDAQKSETQKLTDRAEKAEKRADEAEGRLARLEVALDKGLTPSQAKRLVGNTREELEADADELLADIGKATGPRAPQPDPNQGRQANRPDPGPGLARLVDAYANSGK
jgi:hypothetical protein